MTTVVVLQFTEDGARGDGCVSGWSCAGDAPSGELAYSARSIWKPLLGRVSTSACRRANRRQSSFSRILRRFGRYLSMLANHLHLQGPLPRSAGKHYLWGIT